MDMNYCRRCGTSLTAKSDHFFVCANGHSIFSNPAPSSGIFFVTESQEVILARRGIEPNKGMLDAIGGFVDGHENVEEALAREIHEEAGITADQYDPPVFLCTASSIYPYGGEDRTVLTSLFWSRLKPETTLLTQDDISEIVILPLNDLDLSLLHADDIRAGITKLQELARNGTI